MILKTIAPAVLALLSLAMPAVAQGVATRCNAELAVTDPDPKGLNVRSGPDAKSNVIAVLKGGDYITVHITGQSGQWYAIDSATMIDTNAPKDKVIFHGQGFVHMSKVGGSGMFGTATILDKPDDKTGKPVKWDMQSDQPVDVLGCSGEFLKVKVRKVTGWSKEVCTNELTTCV